jgi:hypothetical protein
LSKCFKEIGMSHWLPSSDPGEMGSSFLYVEEMPSFITESAQFFMCSWLFNSHSFGSKLRPHEPAHEAEESKLI